MSSYQYRDPHVEDKTVLRPSYLQHGDPHTWERRSLYWDRPQFSMLKEALLLGCFPGTGVIPCLSLTHWGQVTHICVSKLTIIGSDNGLSPDRRQAIIWTNAGLLLIGPLGTNFSEILIKILHFHSRKCIWKCRLRNSGHFVSASMC